MKPVVVMVSILVTVLLLFDGIQSSAQVTLWEAYQSAGHQAIEDRSIEDAEQLLLAAANHIEAVSPDDPRLANTLNDLGVLYGTLNRYSEAEALFQRALVINEKAFGRQHLSIVLMLQNLSLIYASQSKFSEAHRTGRESLQIGLQLFGTVYHPRIGSTCRTVATVYALQGRYEEAERFAEKSITIFENTLGERHPETAQSLEMMVSFMRATHRDREARQLQSRLNTARQGSSGGSESGDEVDRYGPKNSAR